MTAAGQDRLDKLRLIRSAHIGPISYRQLVSRFGSAAAAIEAIPHLAQRAGGGHPGSLRKQRFLRKWSKPSCLGPAIFF